MPIVMYTSVAIFMSVIIIDFLTMYEEPHCVWPDIMDIFVAALSVNLLIFLPSYHERFGAQISLRQARKAYGELKSTLTNSWT